MEEPTDSNIDPAVVRENLQNALTLFYGLPEISSTISSVHISDTPARIVKSMMELFKGCYENPRSYLTTVFSEDHYDEMIYENGVPFVSMCAHHALPFFGKAYFAYIPGGKIVGLSKIPRMIESYSRRPQVQEKLTVEIVDTFMECINPKGCGLVMEAYHLCMMIRGVKSSAVTKTTALRGIFKDALSTKQEFLNGVRSNREKIWP